ncbi:MAG: DedA family protein [Mycobacteriales bacterium]
MTHLIVTEVVKHGYLAIFLLMVLESACIPIPSEAIMPFGGALAGGLFVAAGQPHVSLWGVAVAGALGNLVGAELAYVVGRVGGRPLVEHWGRYVLLRHRDLDRAEAFFDRRGWLAVLVGRVLPVIRTFISLPAGTAEMPVVPFTAFTLIGSLPWTFGLAAAGEALTKNWKTVSADFTPATIVIAVICVAVIAWWFVRRARKRGVTASDAPAAAGATSER